MKCPVTERATASLLFAFALAFQIGAVSATDVAAETGTIQKVSSQGAYYDVGDGGQRINLAGRLRMLSQRIPGMACNAVAGIEAEVSQDNLEAAVTEFGQILKALEVGNPGLGINGPEDSPRVLRFVDQVEARWVPFQTTAEEVLQGDLSVDSVSTLAVSSGPLLADAQYLVEQVTRWHKERVSSLASEAFNIDIAGRQRMFAQRMSKNICLVHTQAETETAMAELETTVQLFDATLSALQFGLPALSITTPPTTAAAASLQLVADDWSAIEPSLQRIIDGARLDTTERTAIFHDLNTLTKKMNDAVQLYVTLEE